MDKKAKKISEDRTIKYILSKIYGSPLSLLIIITVSILLAETVIMLILPYLPVSSELLWISLDSSLLTVMLAPLLYLFLLRPLMLHIAERDRLAENLERTAVSKEYVDSILQSMNDCLIVTDTEGRIRTVNEATRNLLGYSKEELVGQPVEKIFSEKEAASELTAAPLITGHVFTNFETNLINRDGEIIIVTLSTSVMRDENGNPHGIVSVAQDITERKWIEEALRESEEYARSFVESSQDCVCNITPDGKYMSMNTAGYNLHDIDSQDDLIGSSCTENIVENRDALEKAVRRAAKGEKVSAQYRTISRKGKEVWWDSKLTPVLDLDGSIRSILRVSRDITKQKEMEKNLIRTQEMLVKEHNDLIMLFNQVETVKKDWENTMDCMGDIIIITDTEGKIRRCNKALLEFTDETQEEILGKDWENVMTEVALETVTFYSGSIELLHKPTHRWFTLNSYPFKDSDSKIAGEIITVHETTETKKITEELENAYKELKATQAQILQREKMASIGQLAAGVAHEINNPMGFITSNIGTLRRYVNKLEEFIAAQTEAVESLNAAEVMEELKNKRRKLKLDYILEDVGELINESLDGAERVKKIVQNLKSFSRVDEADYKPVNINECIESTLNIVWNEIKYNATVDKKYGDIPLTKCYPQQLNQVFVNLLVNAAHAIEKQGEIKIKTWNVDGTINVSISDTGCGIPEEELSRIFEPFFTTKEVGKGTGLGLSISYDIVKKHNGEIAVDSQVGKGTTFTIKIPVVEDNQNG